MSDKRYGAVPGAAPEFGDGFEGWTLEDLTLRGGPTLTEVARDLIAAQARIAELEGRLHAVECSFTAMECHADGLTEQLAAADARIAELDSQATWFSKIARETTDKLAAAEATIARVRELPGTLRAEADSIERGSVGRTLGCYDQGRDHGQALAKHEAAESIEAALSPPAKGGE